MEIIINKTKFVTDVTSALQEMTSQRNLKAKTYHYVAILSDYQSKHNIKRDFVKDISDFETGQNGWSYLMSTKFLNNLKIADVIEVVINEKSSNRYSDKSTTYLVVVENDDEYIKFFTTNTALRAFNQSLNIIKDKLHEEHKRINNI